MQNLYSVLCIQPSINEIWLDTIRIQPEMTYI